jgi:glycosyltransferase involved in cell wall biosynthesis
MTKPPTVSAIVPFYNSERHLTECLNSLLAQDFELPFEIIMINDGSSDNSLSIIKTFNKSCIKVFSLPSNSGPAAARNLGLKKATGEYVFFLDADDTIESETLSTLYRCASETDTDLVFCDCKWIENNKNQRITLFSFPRDMNISRSELTTIMQDRLHNPLYISGPLSFKGKLIKRSIILENNLVFEEELRYMEDEIFMWNVLAFVESVKYLRKQLYNYYVHPNVNTTVVESLNLGFPISKFKIIRDHIKQSFSHRGCSPQMVTRLGDQAFIYFVINVLISNSKSILQGKIDRDKGEKCRRKIIDSIMRDKEVFQALKSYVRSEKESYWIPFAIRLKLPKILEFLCTKRAQKIVRIRKSGLPH